MFRKAIGIVLVAFSFISMASSAVVQAPDLAKEGGLALYSAANSDVFNFRLNYPGQISWVENGTLTSGWDGPDCLILNGQSIDSADAKKFQAIADGIEVRDGAGVLFAGGHGDINLLSAKIVSGTQVYFFKDLGAFVTGVEIRVKNGKTMPQLVYDVFGTDHQNVALTFSRSCKLLKPA